MDFFRTFSRDLLSAETAAGVVSPEEASFGVAEFWSGRRLIGFTCLEAGELTPRIAPSREDVVLSTRALIEALAEADHLLARYWWHRPDPIKARRNA